MRKKILAGLVLVLFVIGLAGTAGATLVTIGTANYGGTDYKLIYDADSPLGPITWLDYSNATTSWQNQINWANGLNVTVTLNPGYTTSIDLTTGWRLPGTVDGSAYPTHNDGSTSGGYNVTSSEMGHLFYSELGNLGYYDTSGISQSGYGLNNTEDFENLVNSRYWSGTESTIEDSTKAWYFNMSNGYQYIIDKNSGVSYGLAVHSGQVATVPIPGALWLLGSGLLGLMGMRRRKNV